MRAVIAVCAVGVASSRLRPDRQMGGGCRAASYFWVATTNGNLAINGTRNIPVYMDFADAKVKLAGLSFHGEARTARGVSSATTQLHSSVDRREPLRRRFERADRPARRHLDHHLQREGAYEVKPGSTFHVVGGIRTLTMSPNAHFTGPVGGQLADIDISKTNVAGVAGFSYRPRLGHKVVLLTQADIGGGSAFTWSAGGGVEFRSSSPGWDWRLATTRSASTPATCPRAGAGP